MCWASGTQASTAPQGKPPSDFWIFLKPFRNISNCLLYQVTHHPQKNYSIQNIIFKSWNQFRKLSLLNLHSFCARRQNLSRSAKQSLDFLEKFPAALQLFRKHSFERAIMFFETHNSPFWKLMVQTALVWPLGTNLKPSVSSDESGDVFCCGSPSHKYCCTRRDQVLQQEMEG